MDVGKQLAVRAHSGLVLGPRPYVLNGEGAVVLVQSGQKARVWAAVSLQWGWFLLAGCWQGWTQIGWQQQRFSAWE